MPTEVENKGDMPIKEMSVDDLIVETFNKCVYLKNENNESENDKENINDLRLIYPKKDRGSKIRISEQELKLVFLNTFNIKSKNSLFYYSVECPTICKHDFKDKPNCNKCPKYDPEKCKLIYKERKKPISARVDVCIYKKEENIIKEKDDIFKRHILIEFKSKNTKNRSICKDFYKLAVELNPKYSNAEKAYFILILDGFDAGTRESLFGNDGKFARALNLIKNLIGDKIITLYILTLRNYVKLGLKQNTKRTSGYYNFDINSNSEIEYEGINYTPLIEYEKK